MLSLMKQTHLILEKDVYSVDDNVGEPLEINTQEENASKSLEFEEPSKEEIEETPQPSLKDDLPKDWQ